MSVNETVNQSQNATAGGSGDSPEKLVADHVDRLWEHIAADGYDLLADVAVESLTRNGDVPPDAYLRSVKMSWCLHRAAVYYARQYSVERQAADQARGDAQFEHSLRAQAEREAEKLKADLAKSALLVENLRLRLDEARADGAKWCEEITKLRDSLGARRQELTASFTANQELRQKLETAEAALLEQQQRNEELVTQNSQQFMKIAELQRQVERAKTQELEGKKQELPDKTQELEGKKQELPEYTPPQRWRVLQVGEVLQPGDVWVNHEGEPWPTKRVGETVNDERYIRPIESRPQPQPQPQPVPEPEPQPEAEPEAEPVQVREGRWRTRGGAVKNIRPCEPLRGPYFVWPWTDGFMTFQDNGRHLAAVSDNDLVEYLGPIEPQVEAVTTNRGDDSGGN